MFAVTIRSLDCYIFYVRASARTHGSNSAKLPASFAIERSAKGEGGSADEMPRKPAKERRERKKKRERETSRAREGERNGAAVVGETFVLEGKDYVCE